MEKIITAEKPEELAKKLVSEINDEIRLIIDLEHKELCLNSCRERIRRLKAELMSAAKDGLLSFVILDGDKTNIVSVVENGVSITVPNATVRSKQ